MLNTHNFSIEGVFYKFGNPVEYWKSHPKLRFDELHVLNAFNDVVERRRENQALVNIKEQMQTWLLNPQDLPENEHQVRIFSEGTYEIKNTIQLAIITIAYGSINHLKIGLEISREHSIRSFFE
jgi:hypothetical protein